MVSYHVIAPLVNVQSSERQTFGYIGNGDTLEVGHHSLG